MAFPQTRLRRLRMNPILRDMVSETRLSVKDLIMPYFVCNGEKVRNEIRSMPGNAQLSVDLLLDEVSKLVDTGVRSVLLFGIPDKKDEHGLVACDDNNIVQQAIRALKKKFGTSLYVIADVCNCEYTTHGHCGSIINEEVDNDSTLEILARQSLSLVKSGADMVAPSDMMDGRVKIIRENLDNHGFSSIPIMSYAAKFASAFYGPFREAAGSAPMFGDRRSYQLNPCNYNEAMREIELDIQEGADIIMVKPALSYLDIISKARLMFNIPIAAYNVSGEFAMVKAAASLGWIDEQKVMMEIVSSIKRAGADIVISYFSREIAEILGK